MNRNPFRAFRGAIALLGLLTVLCGALYPLGVTAVARLLLPFPSGGSLVYRDGACVGSLLLAQRCDDPRYFVPRPSASDWGARPSGGSNLGPASAALRDSVRQRRERWLRALPGMRRGDVPADLLTASASGCDPDISTEAAHFQVPRIARARGFSRQETLRLHALIDRIAQRPCFASRPSRVNVLALNLTLQSARRRGGA